MLTPTQLSIIDQHLRKENWLLNEDLIAELTDHYIDGLTDRLEQGMELPVALRDIHTGFGGRKGLLQLEEEYQVQKARRFYTIEWQFVRSFVQGRRWLLTVCLFTGIYMVNAYMGLAETIESALGIGFLYVSFSVLFNVIQSIVFVYQNRREVSHAARLPGSPVYIVAYSFSILLLTINKYLLPDYNLDLSANTVIFLESLLETLCFIYYAAIALSLKNALTSNQNMLFKKVA